MSRNASCDRRSLWVIAHSMLAAMCLTVFGGCGDVTTTSTGSDSTGGATTATLLSSKGTIFGRIAETSSTRESVDGGEAGQTLPLTIDATTATAMLQDIVGNPLLDENGRTYPPIPVDSAGTFVAENLPVGVDFVVVVDLDGDGVLDISQVVQISADESGEVGELHDVVVDPLTTLVVAKLRALLADMDVDLKDLAVSPTAIVARIVDAYEHLFEETGIDRRLTLEDVENLDLSTLEEMFERLIPVSVRAGFDTVEGNIALGRASELEDTVRAAAEVFVKAGFPVADGPGGIDLAFLGDLPNVETITIEELYPPFENDLDGTMPPPDDSDVFVAPFREMQPVIFVSTVTEPDRNFVGERDFEVDKNVDHLPLLNEHLLARMAELHLQGRGITLRNLYRLLTDTEIGLGVRLMYDPPMMHRDGPPKAVFETADGQGVEIDMDALFFRLDFAELDDRDVSPEQFQAHEKDLRDVIRGLLIDTVPPTFHRLFGAFVSDRLTGVDQLFQFIRKSLAHLPFSRSGPATFFVLADGDAYDPENTNPVNAVTVDVEFSDDYMPMSIVYNPGHTGTFHLGFTNETDNGHLVELLVRETGRPLRDPRGGPLFLRLDDSTLFADIGSVSFVDFVSNQGTFFPGVPVNVANPEFRFFEDHDSTVDDIGSAEFEKEEFGPTTHLFVLATQPGFAGEPVRVDYNLADGTYLYNPNGRYYVVFVPETPDQGLFGLYDVDLNFMPSVNDLTMDRFIDIPDTFEDFLFDELHFVDADGDGFPADIDPNDNDPAIIPDGSHVGVVFVDNDGDGFPADIDPDDNDPTITPDDRNAAFPPFGLMDADGDGFLSDVDPDDNDPNIVPLPDPKTVDADGDGFTADVDPDDNDPAIVPADPLAPQSVPGDGTDLTGGDVFVGDPLHDFVPVLLSPDQILGLDVAPEFFAYVFGTEVPNANYDPSGNPFFDDVNNNGIEDPGEFTSDWRPILFDLNDWRATDMLRYYRRASGGAVMMEDINFDSPTARTLDGEALVPRNFLPRLNAFRFGRPNTAINLLTTFLPPEIFNGTQAFNEDTEIGIFQALAMINLVMEQVFNVEARVDIDGQGPLPETTQLSDARLFVVPVGDPFVLILDGFEQLSRVRDRR